MIFDSKCAVLGNAGSGKTTFAKKIREQTKASVLDLDNITWDRDILQKRRPIEDSVAELDQFIQSQDSWIVEGCYGELIEKTLKHSPMLIFLDPGEELCLQRCQNRPWEQHKYSSKEEQDKFLQFLLSWVSEYYRREGPMSYQFHMHLFDSYAGPKILMRD